MRIAELAKSRVERLSDLAPMAAFLFAGRIAVTKESFAGAKLSDDEMRKALALAMWRLDAERTFDKEAVERVLKGVGETLGKKFRDLARVYYVAMTGSPTSLPLFDSMELLGRDIVRERFRVALAALGGVGSKEQKEWQALPAPASPEAAQIADPRPSESAAGVSARAVVLAAGKGTRMKSARPKVLHELCGRPMLWWVLEALKAAGIDDVVVVTNPELDPLLAGLGVRTVIQPEQLGTGHAVKIALDTIEPRDGTLVVAYGDMPLVDRTIFEDVQAAVDPDAGTALALVTARMPLPSSFGRIIRTGGTGSPGAAPGAGSVPSVERIVEAKDCTANQLAIDEMNAGIYAFDESALREIMRRSAATTRKASTISPTRSSC